MSVKLVSITPEAEKTIMYCARVSSNNQDSENPKLLRYCMEHGHWSIFEMANMVLEINTSRAISAQILRHRSFNFQEFSQRYSETQGMEYYDARRQDTKNRQNSIDDLSEEDKAWFTDVQTLVMLQTQNFYNMALEKGVAKECARMLLPMATSTKLYMNGTIRSWIHYIKLRTDKSTQKEHRDIAQECATIFRRELPVIGGLLDVQG